jgi:DNA-binding response OmpR family regulator
MNLPSTTSGPAEDGALADSATTAGSAPMIADSGGFINILIVDDEPRNLMVLETVLDAPRYRLVRAESAEQALLALLADEFAVLILDVRLPGLTGFELAQMIRERKKNSEIPIIFLTAYYNEDQHVIEGYDRG